tara:strand:- start:6760 stop:6963 length:204 start_codon:yes stop_codon:yes gene_type:complete
MKNLGSHTKIRSQKEFDPLDLDNYSSEQKNIIPKKLSRHIDLMIYNRILPIKTPKKFFVAFLFVKYL